jgi:hypothetical protein
MSELRKDPTPQQLFDRIIRLEAENSRLKKDLSAISSRVDEINNAFCREVANTTLHIKDIHGLFKEIHDYLWPLVHKIFPGWAQDKKAIDEIIGGTPSGTQKK